MEVTKLVMAGLISFSVLTREMKTKNKVVTSGSFTLRASVPIKA
jgi:hypothetical protein